MEGLPKRKYFYNGNSHMHRGFNEAIQRVKQDSPDKDLQ